MSDHILTPVLGGITPARKPHFVDNNADQQQFNQNIAVDTLARTIWGEARGEGSIGMQAVAETILNRLTYAKKMGGYWWGNTIVQICHKPYQFSCWNKNDPNYKKLISIDDTDLYFATAKRIARRALLAHKTAAKTSTQSTQNAPLTGPLTAPLTGGATHYHAAGITPYWAKNQHPSAVIGNHIFYALVEM